MREIGQKGEEKARAYLKAQGLQILCSNFHSRFGEIDIIAKAQDSLHFVEVKTTKHADALHRITPQKLQKIIKTIDYYQLKNPFTCNYQIDAIVVTPNGVEWIQNVSE
jgi:putative endonuclease